MRSDRLARLLVRMYPRAWRARYEDEMLVLIEETGLDARRAADLLLGAAREWNRRFVAILAGAPAPALVLASLAILSVLAAAATTVGTTGALWLTNNVHAPAITWMEDGHRLVLAPKASYLAAVQMLLALAATLRWLAVMGPTIHVPGPRRRRFPPVNLLEAVCWGIAVAIAEPFSQWAMRIAKRGTGLDLYPWTGIWAFSLVLCLSTLVQIYLATSHVVADFERRRAQVAR